MARTIALTVTVLVLVVAGAYVIVDLARWEWNRAILSALIFLSALVILTTASVLHSVRRLGERLDAVDRRGGSGGGGSADRRQVAADVRATIGAANAEATANRRFEWLERPPDRLGVFVPVLLGAGVVLSIIAYLVERLAGAVAGGTLDRRTTDALRVDLPIGHGLSRSARQSRPRRHHNLRWTVGTVAVIVLGIVAVEGIRELTQTRADAVGGPGSTTIELRVDQKRVVRPLPVVVADLWVSCHNRVPGDPRIVAVDELDDHHVTVTIDQAFGRVGKARIIGCLEDLTLDLVLADVLRFDSRPLEPSTTSQPPGAGGPAG
jgi:hypothetical protein